MATRVSLVSLLFLSALLSAAFVGSLDAAEERGASEKVSVNINELFDSMLPLFKDVVVKHGLDPLRLNDLSENLPGIIIKNRNIKLSNGWCQGLGDMKRGKDVILSYEDKILTVDAILEFDILDINYEYLFRDALITRKGDLHGRFSGVELRVVLALDMVNYRIELYTLQIDSIGNLMIKLEGHKLDPILNAAIKALTSVFRKKVVAMVEKEFTDVVKNIVCRLNEKIPKPDQPFDISHVFEYLPNLPDNYPAV